MNLAIFRDTAIFIYLFIYLFIEICLRYSTLCLSLCSSYGMCESHDRCMSVDRSVVYLVASCLICLAELASILSLFRIENSLFWLKELPLLSAMVYMRSSTERIFLLFSLKIFFICFFFSIVFTR